MNKAPHNESSGEKTRRIRKVFSGISARYDLANHVLSLGVDFYWRRVAVVMTELQASDSLLDMCCGTGDFAFAFAGAGVKKITGCDFSAEMIELAKAKQRKLARRGKMGEVGFDWRVADCTETDFEDRSFDVISCAFGVRNMADLQKGLKEMRRLLAEGGRVCILEFTLPRNCLVRGLYLLYFRFVLPVVGGIIAGDLGAYRYLAESVCKWDEEVDLAGELRTAGFAEVAVRSLSCGVAAVYVARR